MDEQPRLFNGFQLAEKGAVGTWVPEEQNTPAWKIFNKRFKCRVPFLHTMSVDYIENFGIPTSGDERFDQEIKNELSDRMLTIVEMVNYFSSGVNVEVDKISDTKEIYELISDHLTAWKDRLSASFHTRNAPIEDLIKMDEFATAVYKYARPQFTTSIVESILSRKMSEAMPFNRQNILAPMKKESIGENGDAPAETEEPKRASMADSFKTFGRTNSAKGWR